MRFRVWGGAAVLGSYLIVLLLGGFTVPSLSEALWGEHPVAGIIILGSLAIFGIGVLDDLSRLSPRIKLLGEFVIVGAVVWFADLSFSTVEVISIGSLVFPEWVGFALACLWITGMANAVNLIDGLDGLASGITLFGLIAVSVVGFLLKIPHVTWLSTLLIGCLLGFLVYNSRPASIFLGDCGSLTLGYLAGCLCLMGSVSAEGTINGIFPFLAFALPVTDCVFSIFRRMLRGRSPFSPDMEHFHHRLMAKGLSHGKAVLAMWAAAFTCSFVAVAAALGKGDQLTALFVFFGFGGFILLRYLGYFRFEFFGQGFSSLLQDRKSTRTAEQAVKDAEDMLGQMDTIGGISEAFGKAAEGMQFHEVSLAFYEEGHGRLGVKGEANTSTTRKSINWKDPEQSGFYSRDKEFVTEFGINGRNFAYGLIRYTYMDGRSSLDVQEEILLERIHDALASLAARVRKKTEEITSD
ncbi:undecaprenyl/decaprenyl-phosphate alpha-N-acetylglucosaminyl 1-phosphate transferase [Verrucomicrobia bacterium]|nr:undecaprenyl/decaprenyl-phosphate alpha-N-acetylglucosaminyl 1-phosphate transferase [Verrucomicrobiota bacterium]